MELGHHEKMKYNSGHRERTKRQQRYTENIFNIIIKGNFPNREIDAHSSSRELWKNK